MSDIFPSKVWFGFMWDKACFYFMVHWRLAFSFLAVLLFVVFLSFQSGSLVKGLDVGEPRLEGFDLASGQANISVSVSNPNFFGLKVEGAVFDVFLDGNRVGEVSRDQEFFLRSGESRRIFLEADVDYSVLGAGLSFLDGGSEYTLRGNVSYSILGLKEKASVESRGSVGLG